MSHLRTSLSVDPSVTLHVERWEPDDGEVRGVVVVAHGIAEHISRYRHAADRLSQAGWLVIGPDHRGHGRSSGRQGELFDLDVAAADLTRVADSVEVEGPRVLLGHSMGSGIAARAAILEPERWDAVVLSGTVLDAGSDVGGAQVAVLSALGKVLPAARLAPPIDPEAICSDPAVVAAYVDDPLVDHGRARLGTVLAILRACESIRAGVDRLVMPVLCIHGVDDELTPLSGARWLADALGERATLETFPGLHEVLNEPHRDEVIDTVLAWLDEHAVAPT